jgi:hypothetical protein
MTYPEDQDALDALQQKADHEAQEYRLTEILRRLYEGVIVPRDDVLLLCAACGIDKRNVS